MLDKGTHFLMPIISHVVYTVKTYTNTKLVRKLYMEDLAKLFFLTREVLIIMGSSGVTRLEALNV